MTHLELDWDSPSYGDYLRWLSRRFSVLRYDQRGNGMSQWENVDISFERMVDDMEESFLITPSWARVQKRIART